MDAREANLLIEKGEELFAQRKYKDAILAFAGAYYLSNATQNLGCAQLAMFRVANCEWWLGDPGYALQKLEEILPPVQDLSLRARILNLKATCFYDLGCYCEAHKCCGEMLEIDAQNFRAYSILGLIAYKLENFEESIELYNKALSMTPPEEECRILNNKALSLLSMENFAEAISCEIVALKSATNPNTVGEIHNTLAEIYISAGEVELAEEAIIQARNSFSDEYLRGHATADWMMGRLLKSKNEPERAIPFYEKALRYLEDKALDREVAVASYELSDIFAQTNPQKSGEYYAKYELYTSKYKSKVGE